MSLRSRVRAWWRAVIRGADVDAQVDEELRYHIESYAEDLMRGGTPREEAIRRARAELGNFAARKEDCRAAWGTRWLDELRADLRYALRMLVRSPGFALVAVGSLALGIGANTAMFSVVQGIILAPLPFPNANRLVFLWQNRPGVPQLDPSYPNFEDWERTSRSFDRMSAVVFHNFDLTAPGRAEPLLRMRVSSSFLATLGVIPAIGRDIARMEDQPNVLSVVLISDRLWKDRFAADRHVAGRSLILDGKSFTVIGVLPAGFHFLADADVITPLRPNMPAIYAERS